MPATQTAAATTAPNGAQARHQSQSSAISATPATQSEGRCRQVPRLPRKQPRPLGTKRATRASGISATLAAQSGGRCRQAPRVPRKVEVNVAKCHACHAKWRQMSPSVTSATQRAAATAAPRKMSPSATLATQRAAPTAAPNGEPSAPPEPAQRHKCDAYHAKWRSMSRSATPATQSEGRFRQVPRLPCKVKADVAKCHACVCGQVVWWQDARCVWSSCVCE